MAAERSEAHEPAGAGRDALGALRGRSPAMQHLYRAIERVAATDTAVLIVGEGGTGKELVAQTIHQMSARRQRPFVPVNCGAITPALMEAELFGDDGAGGPGYFEHAAGGTVFLEEVGEMPLAMQVKLLHLLEAGALRRVGGAEEIRVDVRVIAATHRDLSAAVLQRRFREDLMYRLAVFPLHVPPLRERGDDVELLARHFVAELNARERAHKTLSRNALESLRARPWPGNVRELRNAVQRAFILADRQLEIAPVGRGPVSGASRTGDGMLSFTPGTSIADAQRDLILATLDHYGGDKRRAARTLGISLKTLYNRLDLYGDVAHVRRHHRPGT